MGDLLGKDDIELIAPHRSNRRSETQKQHGRMLRRYNRRWTVEHDRLIPEPQMAVHLLEEIEEAVLRPPSLQLHHPASETGFGIGFRIHASIDQHSAIGRLGGG